MNRLLRISFDTLLTSITPILGWFLLGILVDKNLINIFTLIYPIQFIISAINSIFGVGANISAVRDKNNKSVFTGFLLGTLIGGLALLIIIFHIDHYITFMNMDVTIYRTFAIYAIIQLFFQLILNLALCKLYYEEKNKTANKYSFLFNLINFLALITCSIITKNPLIIISITLSATFIFIIFMLSQTIKITPLKINLAHCIKYDSVYLFGEISLFIIYLLGFKNAFDYGEKYILAISFATLITDTQWDITSAIKTLAQIDIAKREFSYHEHLLNSRKLIMLLISSSLLMGLILYPYYKTNLTITFLIIICDFISMYIYPTYITNLTYLQLEYSALKANICKQVANVIRLGCSFIPSPYCTAIGLLASSFSQFLLTTYLIKKNKLQLNLVQNTK